MEAKTIPTLEHFEGYIGTGEWHRWSVLFPTCVLTDGAQDLAEKCGAYWLMDAIASHQPRLRRLALADTRLIDFQIWHLRQTDSGRWLLTCTADDGVPPAVTQRIEYSDFPFPLFKLYLTRADERLWCIMLPSEY